MTELDTSDPRVRAMQAWLETVLKQQGFTLELASGDASFRRYFRVKLDQDSFIVMDAPPDKEDCRSFIDIAAAMSKAGLHTPQILQQDLQRGFLLLTDLGDQQYLQVLNDDNVDQLYTDAMSALLTLQACADMDYKLPIYDEVLLKTEMSLFTDWLIEKHLSLPLSKAEQDMFANAFDFLAQSALQQPQVPVHRDYHSRNLMLNAQHNPGILDFQDAVLGPVTYDLVSLLRDCYITWPREQVENWVKGYYQQAVQAGILSAGNEAGFLRWFDLMGVQRHLKAAGIFARLNYRDDKPAYLHDVPRTVAYITDVSQRYPELQALYQFLMCIDTQLK